MKKIFIVFIALLIAQLLFALIAGPHSCEWGNTAYTVFGFLVIAISVLSAFFHRVWPVPRRIGFAVLFILLSLVDWAIGFLAGDFRLICKLF